VEDIERGEALGGSSPRSEMVCGGVGGFEIVLSGKHASGPTNQRLVCQIACWRLLSGSPALLTLSNWLLNSKQPRNFNTY
jgi:hypothetical protein